MEKPNFRQVKRVARYSEPFTLQARDTKPFEMRISNLGFADRFEAADKAELMVLRYVKGGWTGDDGVVRDAKQPWDFNGETVPLTETVIDMACTIEAAQIQSPRLTFEDLIDLYCIDEDEFLRLAAFSQRTKAPTPDTKDDDSGNSENPTSPAN